jgi:hypothetical protein
MTFRASRYVPALLATVVLLCSGCSRPSASGTVTFNGTVVDDGAIIFTSSEDATLKTGAKIIDGQFTIPAGMAPGKNRVEIYWNKKTGKQVATPGDADVARDETVQVIPPEFNKSTTLTEEIKSGSNTFAFDLKGTETAVKGVGRPAGFVPAKGD